MLKLIWLIRDRHYWKDRAESLEKKIESERSANRRYEREITSRMLTLYGQPGIAQEKPPAAPFEFPQTPALTETAIRSLSPQQQEDLSMYLEDAEKTGVPKGQAWNDFFQREVLSKMGTEELVDVEN